MGERNLETAIAVRAFEDGFAAGANPLRTRRGHTVDPLTHAHWRRGFEAGRAAAYQAADCYRTELSKRPESLSNAEEAPR